MFGKTTPILPGEPTNGSEVGAPPVPRDTSPTWELEMLISGGVLFSLFLLPPPIDRLMSRWEPHMTSGVTMVLIMVYAYVKGALYTLIAAFILHLGARAYWVGLMGLHSVFPNGIQWDRTQLGPVAQEIYRQRMPTLPKLIARIDNFASVIFSFAFLIVLVVLISMPLVGIFAGLAYLISRVTGPSTFRNVFYVLAAIMTFVPISITLFDLKRSKKLDPAGKGMGVLRRVTSVLYTTQMIGLVGPTLFTIGTNSRRKTTYALFYIVLIGSILIVMTEYMARRGLFALNGADYFSLRSDANSVQYEHYESQWPDGYVNRQAPSIQSDVIKEPYVRLFIPYQPPRHNPGIGPQCPGIAPLSKRGLRMARTGGSAAAADTASERVLRCLGSLHAVTLNGAPRTGLRFRFATHPETGVNGIVAYVPTEGLPRGENVIAVLPPPRRPDSRNKWPLGRHVIPFWL